MTNENQKLVEKIMVEIAVHTVPLSEAEQREVVDALIEELEDMAFELNPEEEDEDD